MKLTMGINLVFNGHIRFANYYMNHVDDLVSITVFVCVVLSNAQSEELLTNEPCSMLESALRSV